MFTTTRDGVTNERLSARKFNAWNRRLLGILLVLGSAALLAGCEPVQSLNPFFEAKDVVFEPALVGTWVSKAKKEFHMTLRFERSADQADAYKLGVTFYGAEENKPKEGTITFDAHLFQAAGSRFLDFYPLNYSTKCGPHKLEFEANENPFGFPTHTVYRIKADTNRLQLQWLDDDFVEKLMETNHLALAAKGTGYFVLTAKTEELKSLLTRAVQQEFHSDVELTRQK